MMLLARAACSSFNVLALSSVSEAHIFETYPMMLFMAACMDIDFNGDAIVFTMRSQSKTDEEPERTTDYV